MAFDVVDAFRQAGIKAMRERAASWFSSFENAIGVEVRDLTVCVSGDTAFAHSLNRYFGKLKKGGTIDMCVRVNLWRTGPNLPVSCRSCLGKLQREPESIAYLRIRSNVDAYARPPDYPNHHLA